MGGGGGEIPEIIPEIGRGALLLNNGAGEVLLLLPSENGVAAFENIYDCCGVYSGLFVWPRRLSPPWKRS